MKWAYSLSAVIIILSVMLMRMNRQAAMYQAAIRYQADRISALRAEHNHFLLPSIGEPLEPPMLISETRVIDSLPDGIYVKALSTCRPCQSIHDSLEAAGIDATFLMEESRDLLANTVAGAAARLPMHTRVAGSLMARLPNVGTPAIAVVRQGRIVAFETGVIPISELRRLAAAIP